MHLPPDISAGSVYEWLTQAIEDISSTMFGHAAIPSGATADAVASALSGQAVIACIGIRGGFELEVAMYFPQALAVRLASSSLDMPEAEIDDQVSEDVAGEFSNMVVGAVKSRVSDSHVSCSMTVPRVIRCEADSPDADRKVHAALAVLRGSAGPRTGGPSNRLLFQLGESLLRVDLHG